MQNLAELVLASVFALGCGIAAILSDLTPAMADNLMPNSLFFIRRRSAAVRSSWRPNPPCSAAIGIRAMTTFVAPCLALRLLATAHEPDSGHPRQLDCTFLIINSA